MRSSARTSLYASMRLFGKEVIYCRNISGEADYSEGKAAVSISKTSVMAIQEPAKVSRDFYKPTNASVDKYMTPFLMDPDRLGFAPAPNDFIVANNRRYNVKEIEEIDNSCVRVICTALTGERRE